jgi:hypothetical protein
MNMVTNNRGVGVVRINFEYKTYNFSRNLPCSMSWPNRPSKVIPSQIFSTLMGFEVGCELARH